MKSIVLIISAIVLCKAVEPDVEKAFRDNEIVSDVLDVAPKKYLAVTYPDNVEVNLGNQLTPTKVKDIPTLKWDAEEGAYYTVMMVDPDAPSRANPIFEFRHWLVMNVPGTEIEKGDAITEYVGSGPPKRSGLHRYVFLVFKQPDGKISQKEPFTSKRSSDHRTDSRVRQLAIKYNLGAPKFGNFYQAKYDEYVPKIHAQLRHESTLN